MNSGIQLKLHGKPTGIYVDSAKNPFYAAFERAQGKFALSACPIFIRGFGSKTGKPAVREYRSPTGLIFYFSDLCELAGVIAREGRGIYSNAGYAEMTASAGGGRMRNVSVPISRLEHAVEGRLTATGCMFDAPTLLSSPRAFIFERLLMEKKLEAQGVTVDREFALFAFDVRGLSSGGAPMEEGPTFQQVVLRKPIPLERVHLLDADSARLAAWHEGVDGSEDGASSERDLEKLEMAGGTYMSPFGAFCKLLGCDFGKFFGDCLQLELGGKLEEMTSALPVRRGILGIESLRGELLEASRDIERLWEEGRLAYQEITEGLFAELTLRLGRMEKLLRGLQQRF